MDSTGSINEVTPQTFQKDVVELSRSMPVVVLFWTEQSPPSVDTRRVMETLVRQYQGRVSLALSDISKDQLIAQQMRIQAVPSIRVIVDGSIREQFEGPQDEQVLRSMLDQLTMSGSDRLQVSLKEVIAHGDWDTAMSILQQALNDEPNNPKYKVEWADVLACKGETEDARKVLDTIPDDEPEKVRPATRLELCEEAAGMQPVSELQRQLRDDENDLEARYDLAIQLAVQHQYEPALENLMFILQTDRAFRDDIGRTSMVRVMLLMSKDSPIAKRYRRRMFNVMH